MKLSYANNLSDRDSYSVVDDRAHTGKRVVKNVIDTLERLADKAAKDEQALVSMQKHLPFIDDYTLRYAMEEFKQYFLQHSELSASLKLQVVDGPLLEAQTFLNNYRVEWPELQSMAKEVNHTLDELAKEEKDRRKKSNKATEIDEHLKSDIEQSRQQIRQSLYPDSCDSDGNSGSSGGGSGSGSVGSSSGSSGSSGFVTGVGPSNPTHKRNRTTGGSWFSFRKKTIDNSGGSPGTRSTSSLTLSSKSLRKMEKSVDKMSRKSNKVANEALAADRALKSAVAALESGRIMHKAQMKEILSGFQRLEVKRSTVVKGLMLQAIRQQRNFHAEMVDKTDHMISVLETVDPEADNQYFIRTARKVPNSWRRLSGNIPLLTPDYHTPVSQWTTTIDEETNIPFYVDTHTGETTWTPPQDCDVPPSYADMDTEPDVHPLPSEIEHERRMELKRNGQTAPLDAANWDAVTDDATGQVYYYNASTGVSSWVWPPVEEEEEEGEEVVEEVTSYTEADAEAGYYQQEEEGEQQPAAPPAVEAAWEAAWGVPAEASWDQQQSTPSRHTRSQSAPVVNKDWVLHTDEETGSQYWFNAATLETEWA